MTEHLGLAGIFLILALAGSLGAPAVGQAPEQAVAIAEAR